MAGQETAAPEIDAALKAAHPAAGPRIGKCFVAVVDPLPEEARPVGAGDAGAVAAGVRKRQRVTDASCIVPSVCRPICRAIGCTTP